MKHDRVWLVSCSGTRNRLHGDKHDLRLDAGVGTVACETGNINERATALSAKPGVVDVDPVQSIDRRSLADLIERPPNGLEAVGLTAHVVEDDGSRSLSLDDLGQAPISHTIIREAKFEGVGESGTSVVIEFSRGTFRTGSDEGLHVLAEMVAPRLMAD